MSSQGLPAPIFIQLLLPRAPFPRGTTNVRAGASPRSHSLPLGPPGGERKNPQEPWGPPEAWMEAGGASKVGGRTSSQDQVTSRLLTCDATVPFPVLNRDPRMCQECRRPQPVGLCGSMCNMGVPFYFCCPLPTCRQGRGRRYFRDKAQAPPIKVVKLPLSHSVPTPVGPCEPAMPCMCREGPCASLPGPCERQQLGRSAMRSGGMLGTLESGGF